MDQGDAVPLAELLEEHRFLLDVAHGTPAGADAAESVVDETYRRWYGLSDAARRRITVPRAWPAETVGGIRREAERETDRLVANPSSGAAPRTSEAGPGTIRAPDATRKGRLRWGSRRSWASRRHDAVARAVCRACVAEAGELLGSLLRSDVTALFDGGGGKVRVPAGPVQGGPGRSGRRREPAGPPGRPPAPRPERSFRQRPHRPRRPPRQPGRGRHRPRRHRRPGRPVLDRAQPRQAAVLEPALRILGHSVEVARHGKRTPTDFRL